jgi:hypothetical protein
MLLAMGLAPGDGATTRSKGAARLGFFIQRQGRVIAGHDGDRVYPGDQLRFTLTQSKPQHVAILGRDGTGSAFVYHPPTQHSAALPAVEALALESSVELDATLGSELVLGVFCDRPFELEPLRASLAATGTLPELPRCSVDELRLEKVRGP